MAYPLGYILRGDGFYKDSDGSGPYAFDGTNLFLKTIGLATVLPQTETVGGAIGTMMVAAPGDHAHPRPVSATRVVLDSNGLATVTYSRTFTAPPAFSFTSLNASGQPVLIEHTGDILTGALYTGCTIKGSRAQGIGGLGGILLIGPLLTALTNYLPFASAANTQVSVLAILPTN